MGEYHKLDVTNRVIGKVLEDHIELFLGKECIGKLVMTDEGRQYDLESGYLREEGRIYKLYAKNCEQTQYAEGCDLGWC
ncbi:DUF2553 family protein [Metabacillus arenae]|uniref:DUF2553 family protein n=1 Tax=Metabacillus arenae TaxID=2771434 RepID=A0A926N9V1_9BACI|nr:DUF2553 family protein [Metabacillus arenae]MBD1380197.1 DUF2553 family protein [Metabacillus arenae]